MRGLMTKKVLSRGGESSACTDALFALQSNIANRLDYKKSTSTVSEIYKFAYLALYNPVLQVCSALFTHPNTINVQIEMYPCLFFAYDVVFNNLTWLHNGQAQANKSTNTTVVYDSHHFEYRLTVFFNLSGHLSPPFFHFRGRKKRRPSRPAPSKTSILREKMSLWTSLWFACPTRKIYGRLPFFPAVLLLLCHSTLLRQTSCKSTIASICFKC